MNLKKRKTTKTKTKETSRTGTESQKWRVFSGFGEGRHSGEKVQRIRSIISRHKIDEERPKMV